jgi:CheY-like chemotaxis protein
MRTDGQRVLVAEDDRVLRTAAVTTLRRAGFDVLAADDGERAVALARAERPDLILLDVVMPRVDGFEALRRLKSDAATRDIPVLVLSNLGSARDVESAHAAGAAGFLMKASLSLADLVAQVRQALAAEVSQPADAAARGADAAARIASTTK